IQRLLLNPNNAKRIICLKGPTPNFLKPEAVENLDKSRLPWKNAPHTQKPVGTFFNHSWGGVPPAIVHGRILARQPDR
ncbi:MAG: hypothetical protein PHQ96_06155, partial [Candidatus Omnitrophica bacterium]|nr:hypothetical protein [Candidatus Omnitrophota bacterium]